MHHLIPPKYCEACGGLLHEPLLPSFQDPPLVCSSCGYRVYLDPKLAVAAVLEHQGRILLLRRAQRDSAHGLWIMPGGHVDRGEVVPQAAIREVREETGLEFDLLGLLGVYSYAGNPVVLCVYYGASNGGELRSNGEALEMGLFKPDELPWDRMGYQSTKDALRKYLTLLV